MTERIVISPHAMKRATEMGVTPRDVVLTLTQADVSYPHRQVSSTGLGELRLVSKRGPISVVSTLDRSTIITVLWNTQVEYARGTI